MEKRPQANEVSPTGFANLQYTFPPVLPGVFRRAGPVEQSYELPKFQEASILRRIAIAVFAQTVLCTKAVKTISDVLMAGVPSIWR